MEVVKPVPDVRAPTAGSRMPRAKREAQMVRVAQALFAERGYQGASIEDIASAAGVTRPMVYNYFGSKDGIYLACLRQARGEFVARMVQAVAGAQTPRDRLAAGLDAYFAFVEDQGSAWDVLFGGGAAVAGPAETQARAMRFETVEKIALLLGDDLQQAATADQLHAFAHQVSGAAEQLAKWWRVNPQVPRATVVDYQMAMCWTGLEQLARLAKAS